MESFPSSSERGRKGENKGSEKGDDEFKATAMMAVETSEKTGVLKV